MIVSLTVASACTPGDGPESIPLPTSPDTTTSTTSTVVTTTTSTTTSTVVPPTFQATIRRTTDGVPHILADDLASLAYGQGWVSAEDAGCNLIDQVLKVRGERAGHLGPGENNSNVESDFGWRALGLYDIAVADFDTTDSKVVELFTAFAEGWNDHLADRGDEGLAGWCAGASWVRPVQPVEAYAYARSVALVGSSGQLLPFITSAQPPDQESSANGIVSATTSAAFAGLFRPEETGSNAWAIGRKRVEGGEGGLLLANPHFPWEGELRFNEVHLTVPGEVDIYGAQLSGLPGVGMGFTDGVAWAHTVSAGKRFTAYLLTLDPESPTTYLVDGEQQKMTATRHEVEILRPDGSVDVETRRLWSTEHGPVIDFPGIGWSGQNVLTYRDANIDNDEFIAQYMNMLEVESLQDLVRVHREYQGVPLFNTVATGSNGAVWYADTSAAPNLSDEAEQIFERRRRNDPLTKLADESGVILLDGSDSRFDWEEVDGARDPGLVPWNELPKVRRTDYVFNANDSYWVPSAEFTLDGDYSIIHGEQDTARSMRTRQNAAVLDSRNSLGLAGPNDSFSADELRAAAFDNSSQNAALLLDALVEACRQENLVQVGPLLDIEGNELLPAGEVNVRKACRVLAGWDGRYDLDQAGPILWRETMAQFGEEQFRQAGQLFRDDFDPDRPTRTPRVPSDNTQPLLRSFAKAVQIIQVEGFAPDSTLGSAQFTERGGERIAIHGGTGRDGVTNVVGWTDDLNSSTEPRAARAEPIVPDTDIRGGGYAVNVGTSFLLAVDLTGDEPEAWAILTYGQTIDATSDLYARQTVRYSEKDWRTVAFSEEAILADPNLTETTVSRA